LPSGVNLPTYLMEGPLTWPGQHAGFLGPRHDPWQITRDPNRPDFGMDSLQHAEGIDVVRLDDRRALLAEVDLQQRQLAASAEGRRLTDQQRQAFLDPGVGPHRSRLSHGSGTDRPCASGMAGTLFGQSLLLARRLVQAGVPVVQANMGIVQNWDSHSDNFGRLRNVAPAAARSRRVGAYSTTWTRRDCWTTRW